MILQVIFVLHVFNKTKPVQLVLKRKINPNVTEKNRQWYIRNAKKEKKKKNPTHKKYEHLAPSVPNNKGVCFS